MCGQMGVLVLLCHPVLSGMRCPWSTVSTCVFREGALGLLCHAVCSGRMSLVYCVTFCGQGGCPWSTVSPCVIRENGPGLLCHPTWSVGITRVYCVTLCGQWECPWSTLSPCVVSENGPGLLCHGQQTCIKDSVLGMSLSIKVTIHYLVSLSISVTTLHNHHLQQLSKLLYFMISGATHLHLSHKCSTMSNRIRITHQCMIG